MLFVAATCDIFIFVSCRSYFLYFVKRKEIKLNEDKMTFTTKQKIIIFLMNVILVINALVVLTMFIMNGLLFFLQDVNEFMFFYNLITTIAYLVLVFVDGIGMLTVFYYMGLTIL